MADSKYGRLFTEKDVRLLLSTAFSRECGGTIGLDPAELDEQFSELIESGDRAGRFTFPADEPLFLLRGQDAAAPLALRIADDEPERLPYDYTVACFKLGCAPEHDEAIRAAFQRMREWQQANPDRVKTPD